MKVRVWGARGSVPAPGPQMNRYGGNTSSVQVLLDSGEQLLLDSGTGIRTLGPEPRRLARGSTSCSPTSTSTTSRA